MKKIIQLIFPAILIILLSGCGGYEPIFSSKNNVKFIIEDYEVKGDRVIANKIYKRLYNTSKTKKLLNTIKEDKNLRKINLFININKSKKATSKDSSGKTLEYKITLDSNIQATDFKNNEEIINLHSSISASYKVQDRYFDTISFERKTEKDLIDRISQEALINLSEKLRQ